MDIKAMLMGFFIYLGFIGFVIFMVKKGTSAKEISRALESAYPKDSDIVCCWCGKKHNEIEKISNDTKRPACDYYNPSAVKKYVKKMVTVTLATDANGKIEEEKLSQDWQRVCDDFSRAWQSVSDDINRAYEKEISEIRKKKDAC